MVTRRAPPPRPGPCRLCPVRPLALFRPLSEAELDAIATTRSTVRLVRAGEAVLRRGEGANIVLTLFAGWAFAYRVLPDGRRQIGEIFLPGDLIGARGAASDPVEAVTDASLCVLSRVRLRAMLDNQPALAVSFAQLVARSNALLSERLASLGRRDAVQRVGALMLELAARQNAGVPPKDEDVPMPLRQTQLGDALGLSAEHVNRALATLRRERLLTLRSRTLRLHDPAALARLCGWDSAYLSEAPGV